MADQTSRDEPYSIRILDWANTVERVYDTATDWKTGYKPKSSYVDYGEVRDRLGSPEDFVADVIGGWQEAGIAKEELRQAEDLSVSDVQMIELYRKAENRLNTDVVQEMVSEVYNIDDLQEEEARRWSNSGSEGLEEKEENSSDWTEIL